MPDADPWFLAEGFTSFSEPPACRPGICRVTAPPNFTGPLFPPPVATHESELQYLFGLPNAQHPAPLNPGKQALAASMQAAWAHFAATGTPATAALPWPAITANSTRMLSLVPPQPQLETDFSTRHHCAFWAAG